MSQTTSDVNIATERLVPLPVPPKTNPSICYRLKALCVFVMMFLSSYFGSIFMQCTLIPIAFVAPSTFKRYIDSTIYLWFKLTEFLLACVLNIHVRQFGDVFLPNSSQEKANFLLLLNHRTRLDWMYTWLLGEQLQSTKIVLKAVLGAIPGAGWAMNLASFIFLERKLNTDTARIKQAAAYLSNVGDKAEVFIFPEGTDLDYHALERNKLFALKTGKPITRYTLHPRVAGTQLLLEQLISHDNIHYVYDATVAYPFEFPTHEPHVVCGILPREVHFLIRRYPIEKLPIEVAEDGQKRLNAEGFRVWLEGIWLEKEKILEQYYTAAPEKRRFDAPEVFPKHVAYDWTTGKMSTNSFLIFLYWFLMLPTMTYLTLTSTLVFIYFCFANILCWYIWYSRRSGIAAWVSALAGFPIEVFCEDEETNNSTLKSSQKNNKVA